MHEDEIPVGKAEDLTGKKFGEWTVQYRATNQCGVTRWKCKCSCGNELIIAAYKLKSGATTKCRACAGKEKRINLTGKRFGRLTVLEPINELKGSPKKWKCQCDCGNIVEVYGSNLTTGATQSCGCLRSEVSATKNFKDLTGQKFGRLTVIERDYTYTNLPHWLCECECGNYISVRTADLNNGHTKSCGCLQKEICSTLFTKDLVGQTFGLLTVISRNGTNAQGNAIWHCKCHCGNECDVSGGHLQTGDVRSCGCIKSSYGEKAIEILLNDNQIQYEREKTFINCKYEDSGKFAKFDFYINNQYIVEYDGNIHYLISGWNTEEKLKIIQRHDKIKNQWCKENNIPLIRIPYTHLNDLCIEDLLLETSKFIV